MWQKISESERCAIVVDVYQNYFFLDFEIFDFVCDTLFFIFYFLQLTVKEDGLPDSPCMYQTLVSYKVPLCVTMTDLSYRPLTLQQHVRNSDAMWYFTMNGWTELVIRKDMKSPMSLQSYVKLQFKVNTNRNHFFKITWHQHIQEYQH